MRALILFLIRCYQVAISPMLGPHCRYYPTCSSYARQAIETHGAWRGSWLALRRLARCHPFAAGGVDEVPVGPCKHASESNPQHESPRSRST